MVVTGDVKGKIQFFDRELKLLNWYDDCMKFGPLCSISFSFNPKVSVMKYELAAGRRSVECRSKFNNFDAFYCHLKAAVI